MLKLGRLDLTSDAPVVAGSFTGEAAPAAIRQAFQAGLDVAELRVDLFADRSVAAVVAEAKKFAELPSIGTIRSASEGGGWDGPDADRATLFAALVPHVDAVDVELGSEAIRSEVIASAQAASKIAILSFHDFATTPELDVLRGHVRDARALGADIVKIATHARDDRDVARLARLLVEVSEAPLVVIAMGAHGTKSRVFFPALGSLLTFAALDEATAPGQLGLDDMTRALARYFPAYSDRKGRPLATAG